MTRNDAICLIVQEHERAISLFPPFRSEHEGYAIILEKLDELWDEVKKKKPRDKHLMRKEAIQVAAMATRFLIDLC